MKLIPNEAYFAEIADMLSDGQSVQLRVKGGSMRPYLRNEKDIVVLSPFNPFKLKKGRIVLFKYRNRYLLHRIVKCENNRFMIQGDGVCKASEKALPSDVIGMVDTIIRPGKKTVPANSLCAMLYWKIWLFAIPIRRYLLVFYDKFYIKNNKIYP
ncbi:MAG: S24/S26 family peptidase [Prevotellaceae bacterium]|jgi:translation initiation factor IF-1|nr:S24/S26 family peptidase [Prevotellaceae bacterium]